MTDTQVIQIAAEAFLVTAKVAAPVLLTSLSIGLVVSLFQSVTQMQEATLSFVPKLIGAGAALLLSGSWMLHELVGLTEGLMAMLPHLLSS